jgi:hypothetical protein
MERDPDGHGECQKLTSYIDAPIEIRREEHTGGKGTYTKHVSTIHPLQPVTTISKR